MCPFCVMIVLQTFHPLVERVSRIEEPTDALVMLLTYIEDIWEDAKVGGSEWQYYCLYCVLASSRPCSNFACMLTFVRMMTTRIAL